MAPLLRGIFRCAICDRPVSLEECRINEDGRAVHENCYIRMTLEHRRRESVNLLVENDRRKINSQSEESEI